MLWGMARPLRIELPGGVYHVTARGDRREPIYLDDGDRVAWLKLLGEVCERHNWRCHGYCLMDNHYHFVVETPDANLSAGMRQLNGVYTQWFNRRHAVSGHLFQGRFKAILVDRDAYLMALSRYVVLNPVRAGLATHAEDWPWSSYRAMVGQAPAPVWLETDWLLAQFGQERARAQQRFADFVAAGVGQPPVWDGLRHQVFLGGEAFVERVTRALSADARSPEVPRGQRRAAAPALAEFAQRYARREAMARAFLTGAYTLQDIGRHFGVHYSTVSRNVRRWKDTGSADADVGGAAEVRDFKT